MTVLERTGQAGYEGGGGLGVDVALLSGVTGLPGSPPVCQGIDRATTAWPLLAGWLETNARALPEVELLRGAEVVEVGDGWARTADGSDVEAEVIIGADGSRSTVRRFVSHDRPDTVYAGYLLWRAMVGEDELPADVPRLRPDEPSREYYSGPYRLVTSPVPGPDGSSARTTTAQPGLVRPGPLRAPRRARSARGREGVRIARRRRRARAASPGAAGSGDATLAHPVARRTRCRTAAIVGLRHSGRAVPSRPARTWTGRPCR